MAGKTTRVVMPQLGESVHEGTISKWLVKPGDKVNAEVPAPVTGILREILAKEGETVQAGAEIAVVEVGAESSEGPDGSNGKPAATPDAPAAPAVTATQEKGPEAAAPTTAKAAPAPSP
jgi:pyruvate/2-oxoglutarate dehydrogenase complex dihydrolipoamide acyltransferase (E2) component